MKPIQEITRSLITRYRKPIYQKFIRAVQNYQLVNANDKVAVCVSGGKDSLLLALLMKELHQYSDVPFEVCYIAMDPGFSAASRANLETNAKLLNIPLEIRETNFLDVAQKLSPGRPCYMCARMRRGFLYEFAESLGCNKIALAHTFDDVIETTFMNVISVGEFKTMMPKLHSTNFQGMELIRPFYLIKERDINNWLKFAEIEPMPNSCPVANREFDSRRAQTKQAIQDLKKVYPNIEASLFHSAVNVNLNCVLGWKQGEKKMTFLDNYHTTQNNDKNENKK